MVTTPSSPMALAAFETVSVEFKSTVRMLAVIDVLPD